MKARDIEIWALQVIDRLKRGQQIEDSRVELKSEWPAETDRAARRIAAHANAARGEPILWLIGVDEEAPHVLGAQPNDLAQWLPQVKSYFDEVSPEAQDIAVSADGATIVALCFSTDRAPYVFKPRQGPVEREVPWRDGTRTRTATRSELLLILSAVPQIPEFELLTAKIDVWPPNEQNPSFTGSILVEVYLRPQTRDQVVVPLHNFDLTFQLIDPTAGPIHCQVYEISPDTVRSSLGTDIEKMRRLSSATIHRRDRDLIVSGPGSLYIEGTFGNMLFPIGFETKGMHVQFTLNDTSLVQPIVVQGDLTPAPTNSNGQNSPTSWSFQKHATTWIPV